MKQSAKEIILARISKSLANASEPPPIQRNFRQRDERERSVILEDFVERLVDYKAIVRRTAHVFLAQVIAETCQQYGIKRIAVPVDLPDEWLPTEIVTLRDDLPLDNTALDECSGVLTGCAVAIAQTGTIILNGGATQGRRALSLVPDHHLCVVYAEQIVGLVPEAIAVLAEWSTQPITLISGPSATSDIELSRVEGVHGPRKLHVYVVDDR